MAGVFSIGLDLGQRRDYSALVVAERVQVIRPGRTHEQAFEARERVVDDAYHIRHAQRWRIGTPYPAVIEDVAKLMSTPPLCYDTLLVFDRTGVGGAVADLVREAWQRGELGDCFAPLGVTFTAGFSPRGAAQGTYTATAHKGDVITRMASLLGRGLLVLPPGLPAGRDLEKELRAYTIKQRATGYVYTEAAHEADHDDLVTALALAVWLPNWIGTPRSVDDRTGDLREKAWEVT